MLDLFNQLSMPQGVEPKTIRQIELTSVILPLVGANKRVSVLSDWVLQNARDAGLLAKKKLTKSGITTKLYPAVRTRDSEKLYVDTFSSLSKDVFFRLARPRQAGITPFSLWHLWSCCVCS